MAQQEMHLNVFEEFGLIFPGVFKNPLHSVSKWCFEHSFYSLGLWL